MHKIIIGVMGPGDAATTQNTKYAYELGRLIAQENWVLLSGGRNVGVMDAVNKGAKEANGLTVGIMPTNDPATFSEFVDIVIITDMKGARNNINVLSSEVVVACGLGAGTTSEIALALKARKKVILLDMDESDQNFFKKIGKDNISTANTPQEAIKLIKALLATN